MRIRRPPAADPASSRPKRGAPAAAQRALPPKLRDDGARLLSLQRVIGNHGVLRLLSGAGRPPVANQTPASSALRIQRQDEEGAAAPQTDEEAQTAFHRGREAHQNGRFDEALRHYEAASRAPGLDPAHMPYLIWNMALARARAGDEDGAMTDAMTYGQYNPQPPAAELIQRIEAILNQASQPGAATVPGAAGPAAPQSDEEARAAFRLGREAYESGRFEEALRQYEAATQAPGLNPAHMPYLIWNMALARARLGDREGAMTNVMDYGQYNPDPPQSELLQRVETLLNQAASTEAGAAGAVPQSDEEARVVVEQAQADYDAGRYEAALRSYVAASQAPGLDPARMPGLLWNMSHAKAQLGDRENAMTDAMAYGQYRPNEALIESLQAILNRVEAGTAAPVEEGGNPD